MREFRSEKVPRPDLPDFKWEGIGALDLEIGCGVGLHPIQYSLENPDRTLIAIERTREKFSKFESRLKNHSPISNLHALHADAVAWLSHQGQALKFDRIFLLYPNPEWKNPARRWIRMPFFGFLKDRLQSGGQIVMATNEAFYADEWMEWSKKIWGFKTVQKSILPNDFSPRTHFEKKYQEQGQVLHEIQCTH